MILNEREMKMAKELASNIVRVERHKEIERIRLQREKQQQEWGESFESLGRAIRNAHDTLYEGVMKPVSMAMVSFKNGLNQ